MCSCQGVGGEKEPPRLGRGEAGGRPPACPASPPSRPNAAPLGFFAPCQHLTRVSARSCQKCPPPLPSSPPLPHWAAGERSEGDGGEGLAAREPPSGIGGAGETRELFCPNPLGGTGLETSERIAAGIGTVFYTLFSALVSSRWLWLFIVFSYKYKYMYIHIKCRYIYIFRIFVCVEKY